MITNVLLANPWMSPVALGLFVVLGPVVGGWLLFRPRLAWFLTGVSLLPVAALTWFPSTASFSRGARFSGRSQHRVVELMANVVLFVAPVLLAGVATPRPALILLSASGLSAGPEAIQAFATAIGRSCDTTDWLSNTIGAAVGAILAAASLRLRRPR